MNIYKRIEHLSDEELKEMVSRRIKYLECKAKRENPGFNELGYHVSENPQQFNVNHTENGANFEVELRCFYNNYIPKGSKMVYGLYYNMVGMAGNTGSYYYIDDDSYILDFCRFVKDKEIEDEFELFDYMLEFIRDYFGYIKEIDRSEMFQLICKDEMNYFPSQKKHSITDFKGKGNALCSEYAVMAQNLMRFFGFESYLMIGHEKVGDSKPESHAFNLINFKHSSEKKNKSAVIDFSNFVKVFDMNYQKIGEMPFIGYIDQLDQEYAEKLINQEEHMVFEDYSYYIIGDTLAKIGYDRTRDYYIDRQILPENEIEKCKTYSFQK